MSRLRIAFALLVAALCAAVPVRAQEQRASIEGTITDSSGAALPGATVEAKGESGGSATTVSDGTGAFRLQALPPGRYEVSATLSGFTASVVNVSLSLGQHARVEMALQVGTVSETIQVTAEVPLVDMKESARFQNLREEFVDKVPKGRDFTSLATQVAGANMEMKAGGLSVDGASASESKYVIDGIETNSLDDGLSGKELITDFVEEVQVKSSGYAAEYSGALGGVVNAITKSGTNDWKGSAWGYYSGDALGYARGANEGDFTESPAYGDGRPSLRRVQTDNTRAEYVTYAKDDVRQVEPGFTLGGPLVKDRVWFFAGYNPSFRTIDREVTLIADGSRGRAHVEAHQPLRERQPVGPAGVEHARAPRLQPEPPRGRRRAVAARGHGGARHALRHQDHQAQLVAVGHGRLHRVEQPELRAARRVLLPGHLRGGPAAGAALPVPQLEPGPRRRAGRAAAPGGLRELGAERRDAAGRVHARRPAGGRQLVLRRGRTAPAEGRRPVLPPGQHGRRGRDRQPRAAALRPRSRGRARRVRPLPGAQLRPGEPEARLHHAGRRDERQHRPVPAGLVDARPALHGERRPAHRARAGAVVRHRCRLPRDGHRVRLRAEAGAAPRLRLGPGGQRQVEGVRQLGALLRHHRLEMPRGSFGADHWLEYYYTLDTPDWTNLVAGRPARPPARARSSAGRWTSACRPSSTSTRTSSPTSCRSGRAASSTS